jgi:hypothetical protein
VQQVARLTLTYTDVESLRNACHVLVSMQAIRGRSAFVRETEQRGNLILRSRQSIDHYASRPDVVPKPLCLSTLLYKLNYCAKTENRIYKFEFERKPDFLIRMKITRNRLTQMHTVNKRRDERLKLILEKTKMNMKLENIKLR